MKRLTAPLCLVFTLLLFSATIIFLNPEQADAETHVGLEPEEHENRPLGVTTAELSALLGYKARIEVEEFIFFEFSEQEEAVLISVSADVSHAANSWTRIVIYRPEIEEAIELSRNDYGRIRVHHLGIQRKPCLEIAQWGGNHGIFDGSLKLLETGYLRHEIKHLSSWSLNTNEGYVGDSADLDHSWVRVEPVENANDGSVALKVTIEKALGDVKISTSHYHTYDLNGDWIRY